MPLPHRVGFLLRRPPLIPAPLPSMTAPSVKTVHKYQGFQITQLLEQPSPLLVSQFLQRATPLGNKLGNIGSWRQV
jgi:hypothetical protein